MEFDHFERSVEDQNNTDFTEHCRQDALERSSKIAALLAHHTETEESSSTAYEPRYGIDPEN